MSSQQEEPTLDELLIALRERILSSTNKFLDGKIDKVLGEKIDKVLGEKIEKMVGEKLDKRIDEKLGEKIHEKLDKRIDEKLEEKMHAKLDKRIDEKLEEKIPEKLDKKLDEKLEEKIPEKLGEKLGQKLDEKLVRELDEKVDEMVDGMVDEKLVADKLDEKLAEMIEKGLMGGQTLAPVPAPAQALPNRTFCPEIDELYISFLPHFVSSITENMNEIYAHFINVTDFTGDGPCWIDGYNLVRDIKLRIASHIKDICFEHCGYEHIEKMVLASPLMVHVNKVSGLQEVTLLTLETAMKRLIRKNPNQTGLALKLYLEISSWSVDTSMALDVYDLRIFTAHNYIVTNHW